MKAENATLGEVCNFVRGVTFPAGEAKPAAFTESIACLTTSGVQNEVAWASKRYIPNARVGKPDQRLQAGDILISTANSKELVGKSCLVRSVPFSCTFGAFVTLARPNKRVLPAFLGFWMTTPEFRSWCFRYSSNTTNISNLRVSELKELPIVLPDLTEQKRIAAILERADRLRRLRRYGLKMAETFLPAAFRRMFGDPVSNPKGWKIVTAEEAGRVQLGRQRAPQYQTGKYRRPYIRVANVYENRIDLSDLLHMDFDENDFAAYKLEHGDILLNEGQSTELVGRPAMWRNEIPDCCFQNTLIRFQCNRTMCLPAFALWVFITYLHASEFAKISAKTSNVAHLGAYRLAQMRMPVPPLSLQGQFAEMVERNERLRAIHRESLRQAEHLFQTLLHRAFTSE